jgi:hypothetical protein
MSVYDDISLSTMDPNPTIDDFYAGTDGGASDTSVALMAAANWGNLIGGMVNGQQTFRAPIMQPFPPAVPTAGRVSDKTMIVILILIVLAAGYFWAHSN